MRLSHVNLRVADAAACRDFYCAQFGFEPAFEAEGGFFLRGEGGTLLAVIPTDDHLELPEGFHIGFSAASPDEVRARHQALSASGITVGELDDHRPGSDYVTFRCWDPDRTEVEVFWEGG